MAEAKKPTRVQNLCGHIKKKHPNPCGPFTLFLYTKDPKDPTVPFYLSYVKMTLEEAVETLFNKMDASDLKFISHFRIVAHDHTELHKTARAASA